MRTELLNNSSPRAQAGLFKPMATLIVSCSVIQRDEWIDAALTDSSGLLVQHPTGLSPSAPLRVSPPMVACTVHVAAPRRLAPEYAPLYRGGQTQKGGHHNRISVTVVS